MAFILTPYVITCALTAAIAGIIAWAAWQRRAMPGGASLALLMLAVAEWSLGAALELGAMGIPAKIFWSKIEYLGTTTAPVFFLTFALEYNRLERWLTRRNVALLLAVPALTVLLAFTNEWHHWIWTSFVASPAGLNLVVFGHGPWFWVGLVGYSYLANVAATGLLFWAARRFPPMYRWQTLTLLIATVAPWAASFVYVSGLSPMPGLDLTPISFAITGVLLAWGIFRLRLFDLLPVARDVLIETMSDGVLVLDEQDRVVDINPAAQRLLHTSAPASLGQRAASVFAAWPHWITRFRDARDIRTELAIDDDHHLELSISPVLDRQRRPTGRLIVMRDITARKQAEAEAQRASELLRTQLLEINALQADLREQAVRDPLTGLFNRRYLAEMLDRELARAARESTSVGVVMLDIDHFKGLNDSRGHKAGDVMLQALGQLLRLQTRLGDIACRYGGEEFVIILPKTTAAVALRRAEQLRAAFEVTDISHAEQILRATLSGGVAAFPANGVTADAVLRAADAALYAAKAAGRNRVIVA